MRVAIVHDWITGISGSERVLKSLHRIFPDAPIYALFSDPAFCQSFLPQAEIRNSFLQRPFRLLRKHQFLTPLMALAVESFDLSEFDLVISSGASFSKGVIVKPSTRHIHYCSSPMRQVWDWHAEYRREKHRMPRIMVALWQHLIRLWDRSAAHRVDEYIANSQTTRARIKKYYHADARVIYPAIQPEASLGKIDAQPLSSQKYFLIVSRLCANKNIDIAIAAFNKLSYSLVIIGTGPERKRLEKMAGKNIHFLGYQSDQIVASYYAHCQAFIMPQEEDFGLTPIEAFSYGKPVLALRRGGALEYIQPGVNGEFFEDPVVEVLAYGIQRIKQKLNTYDIGNIQNIAEKFSEERFKQEILSLL